MAYLRRLALALQFLTVAPLRPRFEPEGRDLAGSMAFYPLVGLLLGAVLAGFHALAGRLWPAPLAALLTVALLVLLTRGLHLDGLADAADGLGSGIHRERILEIMKDHHCGAFAVVALVLNLSLKWAGLASLAPALKTEALLLAPLAGRLAMVAAAFGSPHARAEGGLARPFLEGLTRADLVGATASALLLGLVIWGLPGLLVTAGAFILARLARRYFLHRLNGVTGDLLGATGEITETLVLLALAGVRP